jgi:hypothetical protein
MSSMVVAYLFTLRSAGRHPLERAWSKYFDGCPAGSVVVQSHTDAAGSATLLTPSSGVFANSTLAETIKVHRFGYSMVKARLLLLRHTSSSHTHGQRHQPGRPRQLLLAPSWYLFFSDSCAPLLPCVEVHAYLERHSPRSFVQADPCDDPRRLHGTSITMETCRKSMGWVGLHRDAALRVLQQVGEAIRRIPSRVHAISQACV